MQLFYRQCMLLPTSINRAELICATVIMKHNYILMGDHLIVINTLFCLLNYTGDVHVKIYTLQHVEHDL